MNFKISKFVKFFILFFQIISILSGACIISMIYFLLKDYQKVLLTSNISHTNFFVLLCFISYISIKSIIVGIFNFWFVISKEDFEIIENRHLLIAFSITIGGVITPMFLTLLPNVTTTTTNDQKKTLSKIYTQIYIFCGMMTFFISTLSFNKRFNPVLENDNSGHQILIAIMIIALLFIVLGFLNLYKFYFKNSDNENTNQMDTFSWILIYINQFFITLNLIFVIIISITRFLYAIYDFIYSVLDENGIPDFIDVIFAIFRIMDLVIIGLYTWWIVKLSINSIKVIWTNEENITIYSFKKLNIDGQRIKKVNNKIIEQEL